MARRADQVRHLAELLSQREHSRPVTPRWEPARYDDAGGWVLSWTDGPTWDTLRYWAKDFISATPSLAGLTLGAVWGERVDSPFAWAALLIRVAGPATWREPRTWRSAAQLREYVDGQVERMDWLDEIEEPGDAVAAQALLASGRGNKTVMARMVLAEWRALPPAPDEWTRLRRATSRCEQCGALFLVKPGPEQRWCTPRCRLRHWRVTQPSRTGLTETGNEPRCVVCGQPLPRSGGRGRPAAHCSPSCRQFAHHHRHSDAQTRAAAYQRRRARPPAAATPPPSAPAAVPRAVTWAAGPPRTPRVPRPPLRPELQGCLRGGRTVHQLHLVVDGIDPPIWRRLQVASATPLIDLSDVLCVALGWDGDHLHSFSLGGASYASGNPDEHTLTLTDVLPGADSLLFYTYDFGDDWLVTIRTEKIITRPPATTFYPRCTGGRRNGPAEDCGGPPGYDDLLKALRARKGWRYRQAREQHPGWRPEHFDQAEINHDLERHYLHQQPA